MIPILEARGGEQGVQRGSRFVIQVFFADSAYRVEPLWLNQGLLPEHAGKIDTWLVPTRYDFICWFSSLHRYILKLISFIFWAWGNLSAWNFSKMTSWIEWWWWRHCDFFTVLLGHSHGYVSGHPKMGWGGVLICSSLLKGEAQIHIYAESFLLIIFSFSNHLKSLRYYCKANA